MWDAAIAALVAWRLGEEDIPIPGWVHDPDRALKRTQFLRADPADPEPTHNDGPAEYLRRGVLAWRDTFESV